MEGSAVKIKAYNKSELSNLYKIERRAFNKLLNLVPGLTVKEGKQIFIPKDVEKIFQHLGAPESEFVEE